MSSKSPTAPPPLPEFLLLGVEGVGKSTLARQFKRSCGAAAIEGEEEQLNIVTAPTVRLTASGNKERRKKGGEENKCVWR